jgi:hypothetical protein
VRHFSILLGTILCLIPIARATTYLVTPEGTGDFPTIQAAIDSVQDGDTIMLADGAFTGEGNRNLDLGGKAITICSRSGNAAACVIDCGECAPESGQLRRGFFFHSGEDSVSIVRALTIANGIAAAT